MTTARPILVILLAALTGMVPASPPAAPAEVPTPVERDGLARLHRMTVELFVARPGFGVRRLMLPLDDVVHPRSESETGLRPGTGAVPTDGRGSRPSHFAFRDVLAAGQVGRIQAIDGSGHWVVRDVHLIGLLGRPEGVVYLAGPPAALEAGAAAAGPAVVSGAGPATREPDAFEAEAVRALHGGGGPAAERRGREMRAVGPIHAGARCLGCHEHRGQLLGAFTYRLEWVAAAPGGGGR